MGNFRPDKRGERSVKCNAIQFREFSVDLGVGDWAARAQEKSQNDLAMLGHPYPGRFQKPQNITPVQIIFTLQDQHP
jgi:hypothetical protein